ncbi:P27 family phage terminase small subunit [Sulfurimonas sp. HSL-1716]|uniref:P27 family phage terminase small subunit n=1 Tax=Hydrocurvibacter sulfurireducens TaxID=3131937 RepID=UPI0031FA2139
MAKGIDWEYIRSEFEETTKSENLIAEQNDVSRGALQRRRDKEGWIRKNYGDSIKDKSLIDMRNPILGKIALRKVDEVKKELGNNYSSLDEPVLVGFALSYERWLKFHMIIQSQGSVEESSKGTVYISPYENLAQSEFNNMMKAASQLGLSIASRKRLNLTPESEKEEASLFDIADQLNDEEIDV